MKKIEIKFTTVLIIALILILTAVSIYMYNAVNARYEMNKQIQIAYKTPDYYFDVTTDVTEIKTFPATINITAKNNNGTSYTTEDLTYTIGVDNPNYTITVVDGNTRTLAGGSTSQETYAITIAKKVSTDTSDKINLVFTVSTPYADIVNKELEIKTIPAYYGALVTNYSANGVSAWRVFHKDEDGRVYLIADKFVLRDKLPTSTAGTKLKEQSNSQYLALFAPVLNDYTGSAWILNNTNANAQKWLNKYLTSYPDSTNGSIKAVAYMMDTNKWSSFVNSAYAEYAIGGPTIELFCASYKVTHPGRYIECDYVDGNGYRLKWSDDTSYSTSVRNIKNNEFSNIYTHYENPDDDKYLYTQAMASPANNSYSYPMLLQHGTTTGYLSKVGATTGSLSGFCFRPIVCLNDGVDIVSNGDGTYSIS